MQWIRDSENQELESFSPVSTSYFHSSFQPSLKIGHPLQSGYNGNQDSSNSKQYLTKLDFEVDSDSQAFETLPLASKIIAGKRSILKTH